MNIQVPASSILLEACRVFKEAKTLGIETPTLFSRDFKYELYSKYRDLLNDNGIDPQVLGDILGNNSRWGAMLNKFMVLNFLEFFGSRLSTPNNPSIMAAYHSRQKNIGLRWYRATDYSPTMTLSGPTLSIGDPRVLAIKMKVQYPNVSKGQNEYMFKWVNMRYDITHLGTIKLEALPRFKAIRKPSGRGLTTEGMIKSLTGTICKFSYGQLAILIKKIISNALKILADEAVDESDLMSVHTILDVVNLIWKTSAKFEIATTQSSVGLGPLFEAVAPTSPKAFKINDDEIDGLDNEFFVVFGGLRKLESILNREEDIVSAYRAEVFQLGDINLYGELDENESIYALVFKTSSQASAGDTERAIFEKGLVITNYEIWDEDEILDNFL